MIAYDFNAQSLLEKKKQGPLCSCICLNSQNAFTSKLAVTSVEGTGRTESKCAELQLSFS